jgi:hypothetical protein
MAGIIKQSELEEDRRLYYRDGTESHSFRFAMRRDRQIKMAHEPILTPHGVVDVVFA